MAITAKPLEQTKLVSPEEFELFTTETATSADGESVEILKSLGFTSLSRLESEKESFNVRVKSIDEKIAAIKALDE